MIQLDLRQADPLGRHRRRRIFGDPPSNVISDRLDCNPMSSSKDEAVDLTAIDQLIDYVFSTVEGGAGAIYRDCQRIEDRFIGGDRLHVPSLQRKAGIHLSGSVSPR